MERKKLSKVIEIPDMRDYNQSVLFIEIRRQSIKKNPNAGNTRTTIQGPMEIRGSYKGGIPERFLKEKKMHITSIEFNKSGNKILNTDFLWISDPKDEILLELQKDKKCSIRINGENIVIDHLPEPKYFYSYKNPLIECSSCNNMVRANSIQTDYDDYGRHDVCPKCEGYDTFPERQYEDIEDALKGNKIKK